MESDKPAGEVMNVTTSQQLPRVLETADRISIVGFVHLEHFGETPESIPLRVVYNPQQREQLYTRRLSVAAAAPMPLDLGWVKTPGMILIENRAGQRQTTIPTKEQEEAAARLVLEVVLPRGDCMVVRPGRVQIVELEDPSGIVLRAREGVVPITVNVYSR